eukprot:CAMPEP_0113580802 /NCGR_PEP_ID=MMETSP0015_2-20120614/30897_1 /TAXON_ID=2838 /ORGANISM="Odontella" /LENGTH=78 /DNA_ID=CAMNT_0000485075 /DNA_START=40 /DNA_END=277 /DNA_ORIENTATION=- /assembly_acc=CAM_ASM_000160
MAGASGLATGGGAGAVMGDGTAMGCGTGCWWAWGSVFTTTALLTALGLASFAGSWTLFSSLALEARVRESRSKGGAYV